MYKLFHESYQCHKPARVKYHDTCTSTTRKKTSCCDIFALLCDKKSWKGKKSFPTSLEWQSMMIIFPHHENSFVHCPIRFSNTFFPWTLFPFITHSNSDQLRKKGKERRNIFIKKVNKGEERQVWKMQVGGFLSLKYIFLCLTNLKLRG